MELEEEPAQTLLIMNDFIEKLKTYYRTGDITVKIIFICVAIFLLSFLIPFFSFGTIGNISAPFAVKMGLSGLLKQPWGIFTYGFFHGGIFHLLFNMLMLYYVGRMFLTYFKERDLVTFLLFGAVAGALAFMFSGPLIGGGKHLIGASAAVYAIFFALMAYVPNMNIRLFFFNKNIPLYYIGYGLLALNVFMILSNNNTGGHISHLAGAAFGYFYMKGFEKGNDPLGSITKSVFYREKKKNTERTYYKKPNSTPRNDYDFNSQRADKQKEVDKILDKISRSGYESLTKEEKEFLFNAGKDS